MRCTSLALLSLACCAAADPSPYFLTPPELNASRGLVAGSRVSTGLADYSHGNGVELLVDGKAFFSRLYEDLVATKAGDVIQWGLFIANLDIHLIPPRNETKLGVVLKDAIRRGVVLRVFANQNLYIPTSSVTMCHELNRECHAARPEGGDCCLPEYRHGHPTGSVHEKTWLIGSPSNGLVAYAGSMDSSNGRWDESSHSDTPLRQGEPPEAHPFGGWHGNMLRFAPGSPVVRDFARRFWLHWHMPHKMHWPYVAQPYEFVEPAVTPQAQNVSMQLLQTLGCVGAVKDGYYTNAAPRGERSIMDGAIKAIKMATKYVVIEDQFMFFQDFMEAVEEVLPRLEAFYMVTDAANTFDTKVAGFNITAAGNMRAYHQRMTMGVLTTGKNAQYAHKVRSFALERLHTADPKAYEGLIYIHSKNYFVDDEFVVVGSGGLERASMTNDYEVAVGIADTKFVSTMRRRLWAEYLNVAQDDAILDDMTDLAAIDARISTGETRLRPYAPRFVESLNMLERELYELYEPEGRCDDATVRVDNTAEIDALFARPGMPNATYH
eukprot:TRINITY_DN2293_c1_g2_i1.p1 TRINITY_DN2293_c1_g2~~TRINITY_DN2293_c1_g2_i1.p1  ORF type:complete len:551 (+),score=218.73 TRINITY_DN2293_c1_g2_i1:70-1722(+)